MIPGLPNPWLILAVILALGGAFAAGDLRGHRAEKLAWETATAKLQAEAAQTLATETAKTADKEAAAAALADKVETDHVDAEKKLAAVVADYDARLRGKRLRDETGRGGGSCGPASPSGNAAGSGAQPATGSGCELSQKTSDDLRDFAIAADAFRLYSVACHDWSMSLGR